jgi:hypothetical protein
VRTLVIDGNRRRRLPSIRCDLHPILSSLTTPTGQRPRTLPAAHHHSDTQRQRRGDATSPIAERAPAASRPQPSSMPCWGDYMARQRSPPDVPRRLPVAKHAVGTRDVTVDDNNTTQWRTTTARHDATHNDHEVPRRHVRHHWLPSLLLYDHCCCSWLYQVVISVLIIAVSLLVCSILISVNINS